MRVCSSCGRENPDDRDFCECGEYLRWDPTGVVQAVTPEVLQAAQQSAPPAAQTPPAAAPARAPPPPAPPAEPAEPDPAAITLRLPEGEQVRLGETLAVGADPGG